MDSIAIPQQVLDGRPDHRRVRMGPPRGVSGDDCGTADMMIGSLAEPTLGPQYFPQRAYFRPTALELEQLNAGGFIELTQFGSVVQPFGMAVWDGPVVPQRGTGG